MAQHALRLVSTQSEDAVPLPALARGLVANGTITSAQAEHAIAKSRLLAAPLSTVFETDCDISATQLTETSAEVSSTTLIDPMTDKPDPRLLRLLSPQMCLELQVLPWRISGAETVLLTPDIAQAQRQMETLEATFGPVIFALADAQKIQKVITDRYAKGLSWTAEAALHPTLSCRSWNPMRAQIFVCMALTLCCWGAFVAPVVTFGLLYAWVVLILSVTTVLKLGAIFLAKTPNPTISNDVLAARLPTITLLIPLFKEHRIAKHLIQQLQRLDYPKPLLDVCLIMESDDIATLSGVENLTLPRWIRPVVVPAGTLRTKPRALNFAMNFARGSIIGVYDAEDAPDPDQLRIVARMFDNADPSVACVQGTLDYYNAAHNWLSRCFTIEYASWFRVILPGYARMGLVVPLGGTTLFFRREVLDELGGWDAYNVTEDADLGVRLARRGYRTVFMPSVTQEEANARMWPWIKQRSRWLKGYAVTYAVHMRTPITLLRELGLWRFLGLQILFLGTLSQFLMAPLLWSIIVIPFGIPHPATSLLSDIGFLALTALFFASAAINLFANCLGVIRADKPWLIKWAPTLLLYFPLGTLGAIKGLSELLWRPFYWDKTAHGIDMPR